jgi:DNA-binding NtrC family response regulator
MAVVLIVDDDEQVLGTLAAMLSLADHAVITARGGTDALDVIDRNIPLDLLVTDVIMPGLNGFSLARMARMRRPDLRILYVTGYVERTQTLRDVGPWYGKLLMKPIMPAAFRHEVAEALSFPPQGPTDPPP